MPILLRIENYPDLNTKDNAQLAAAVNATDLTATVDGATNIATNDFVMFGRVGQQSVDPVEKRKVTVSGSTLTVSALTYGPPIYSPVKAIYGDQLQVFRAADVDGSVPADNAFTSLGSKVDLQAGQVDTEIIDDTGSTSYWYKWRFYNSFTTAYTSDLEDVDAVRGQEYGNYTTIAAVRKEAGITNNPYISDQYVRDTLREAQSVINSAISGIYDVPLDAPVPGLIERAAKVLTAGYILKRESDTTISTRGQAKIDEVLGTKENPGILTGILTGDTPLSDSTGNALTTVEHVTGWPNATTADTAVENGGSKRKFRMGDRY